MRKFELSFTVPETLLTTVVSLLTPEVGSLNVKEMAQERCQSPEPRFIKRATNTVPFDDRRTSKVALDALASGPKTLTEIGTELEKAGYAATGASPVASGLMKKGVVSRIAPATYALNAGKESKINGHAPGVAEGGLRK